MINKIASLRPRLLLLILALLVSPAPLLGQQDQELPLERQNSSAPKLPPPHPSTQQPGSFVIKRDVNRVIVDVVVTDSNRKPVPGLTKQDFAIAEERQPQTILSFDAHTLDSSPSFFVAKQPPLPPNTFVNVATAPERGPLYILLLDLVNTGQDDQVYARQQLLKFINSKPDGTRFAVFLMTDGLHLVQGFTSDREQLYAALDPSHPRPHVPSIFLFGSNYGRGDPLVIISVLKDIAEFVDGLPGRKNVIWVAGSFPLNLFPSQAMESQDLSEETREMLDALARSESALYPVDVRGVVVSPAGEGTVVNSGVGGLKLGPAATVSSISDDYVLEDTAAGMTGGRAFYNRNDLKDALEEATEAGAEYYTLTYAPTNDNYDGKIRTIQVQLSKTGYHLEYRHAYVASPPESPIMPARFLVSNREAAPVTRPIGDSLSAYMQHGSPTARGVYFRAHVQALGTPQLATQEQMASLAQEPAYFRLRKKLGAAKPLPPVKIQTYLIKYTIVGRVPNLEVAAAVYDDDGRLLNGNVMDATSAGTASSEIGAKPIRFRLEQPVMVPMNGTSMRLAVRDLSTDRIGAIEIPLPLALESAPTGLPVSNNGASAATKSQ